MISNSEMLQSCVIYIGGSNYAFLLFWFFSLIFPCLNSLSTHLTYSANSKHELSINAKNKKIVFTIILSHNWHSLLMHQNYLTITIFAPATIQFIETIASIIVIVVSKLPTK